MKNLSKKPSFLLALFTASLALGACTAEDRASIGCIEAYDSQDPLRKDCIEGTRIADNAAVNFARDHRFIPFVSVPDMKEVEASKQEAIGECVERARSSAPDSSLQTRRELACEAGIGAYARQLQILNHAFGDGR
jgi:hypothetical protein